MSELTIPEWATVVRRNETGAFVEGEHGLRAIFFVNKAGASRWVPFTGDREAIAFRAAMKFDAKCPDDLLAMAT